MSKRQVINTLILWVVLLVIIGILAWAAPTGAEGYPAPYPVPTRTAVPTVAATRTAVPTMTALPPGYTPSPTNYQLTTLHAQAPDGSGLEPIGVLVLLAIVLLTLWIHHRRRG